MKITFILHTFKINGSNRVMFEYANQLIKLGHGVTIVSGSRAMSYLFPETKYRRLFASIISFYGRKIRPDHFDKKIDWLKVNARTLRVPDLSERYIPDADVVIASAWQTAEWVNSYGSRKGKKFYLIQSEEVLYGPEGRVSATYKMPMKKIAIATWIKELINEKFNEPCFGPVTNGVNLKIFYNEEKKFNGPKRIGMLYHTHPWKGVAGGLKAFEMAKSRHPDIELIMFSTREKGPDVPDHVKFYHDPAQEELRRLYCSFDIFLSASTSEGCQLAPMEAMACKCAVVATNVGGIPDYAVTEETALVSPPNDPQSLGRNLIRLIEDDELLKRISIAGYEKIRNFTWEKAANELNKIITFGK
jgi:glycosyltransferase involved in cell wall biosynthesis